MSFTRAVARAMLPRLVGYGWNTPKIIGWLRVNQASYRRSDMLSDVRKYTNLAEFSPKVINSKAEDVISRSFMGEVDMKRPRKYRIYAQAKYTNLDTGSVTYEHLSFYDDTARSKQDWSDEFQRSKDEAKYLPQYAISNIDIIAVEHNRGLSY